MPIDFTLMAEIIRSSEMLLSTYLNFVISYCKHNGAKFLGYS